MARSDPRELGVCQFIKGGGNWLLLLQKSALGNLHLALSEHHLRQPLVGADAFSLAMAVDVRIDPIVTIKVCRVASPNDNSVRREAPMPRYDEVTQRAGSVGAITGLTEPEFWLFRSLV
jgi:hypothetical protein